MVWIPGGEFSMGATAASEGMCELHGVTRDALPVHRVYVDPFWMDETEVTNAQFAIFVKATGYRTVAERVPTTEDFPGAPPENLVAGSILFAPPPGPVRLDDHYQWWRYQKGASWRHPLGAGSDLKGRENYPVVHVAYADASFFRKLVQHAHHILATLLVQLRNRHTNQRAIICWIKPQVGVAKPCPWTSEIGRTTSKET